MSDSVAVSIDSAGGETPPPATTTTRPAGATDMVFRDVCADANGKRILWEVSGRALPGQMLALMGPSGNGDSYVGKTARPQKHNAIVRRKDL